MRILEQGDEDEASDRDVAVLVAQTLQKHYPDHPWLVGFQGRGLVIRHLAIASEVARICHREGFSSLLPRNRLGTRGEIIHSAVEFGGRLLEAFELPRGRWDGSIPVVPRTWTHRQEQFT